MEEVVESKVEQKKAPIFILQFEDGTSYEGGVSYDDLKWLNIPNKRITQLYYRLPFGDYLLMGGYDAYYHHVEVAQSVLGKEAGTAKLEYANLLGKIKDSVVYYRISLSSKVDKEEVVGDISKRVIKADNKKVTELNVIGWKGEVNGTVN